MTFGELLVGGLLLALTTGSSLAFGIVVSRRRVPELAGAPRGVAVGLLALLAFYAIHLVPGALGILGRGSVAACALLLVAAAWLVRARPARDAPPAFPTGPSSRRLSWALALAGAAAFGVYALAFALDRGGGLIQTTDLGTFHLPNVARWIQSGSFWQIDDFVPHRAFGTYPHTSDVVLLGVVLPFRSEFLVPLVNYPPLALAALATYALARELTAPAAPALLFAAAFTAMPVVSLIAFESLADTVMLAGFAAGLLFLARHRRTGARADLVLAGIGLGISFGTKWYAVPAVAIAVAGWALLSVLGPTPWRRVAVRALALAGIVAAAGGFWLLRNLVETGNPLFPVEVGVGPVTIFDAPRDVHRELLGETLADYLDRPRVWRQVFWPNFLHHMSWVAVLLWLCLPLAGALAWGRRGARRRRDRVPAVLWGLGCAAAIGLVYLFIPYTALGAPGNPYLAAVNARYVVPALLIGAAVGAWVAGRLGRLRPLLEALALLALGDALVRNLDVPLGALAAGALMLAGLMLTGWGARALIRRHGLRWSGPAAAGATACAAGLLLAGLAVQEERFADTRYEGEAAPARWISAHAPSGKRIGVLGEGFVVQPMFGPRLENEVEYVGPVVDGMLRTYGSRGELAGALEEGDYDLVLLQDSGLIEPGLPQRQERWLRELGYRLVASGRESAAFGQPVRLYRAPPEARRPSASERGRKPSSSAASVESAGLGAARRAGWSG